MDIKQNSTMIIALAIAVVVVMSVMVPIISDTMDNAGSGNGGGGSNNSYVNEGSMYMKSKNSMANDEVHFLSFVNTGSKIEFRMDGDVYTEKNITGTDFWNYPILIMESGTTTNNGSEVSTYTLFSFERSLEGTPVISANRFSSHQGVDERWIVWDAKQIAFDFTDTEIEIVEFQFHASGMSVLVNTESEGQDVPYDMFLMTDGDWVVAENPVVDPNQKIYSFGERRGTSNGITYSAYTYGYGQASYFTDFYYDAEIGYGIDPSDEESEIHGYVQNDVNINVELTDTDYGVRLGTMNYKGDWYTGPDEDPLFSTDESFNTYIVPKVVKVTGETQAGWLTSQLPSEPITITCKEIETGKMAVYYNYDYSYNAENTPIYVQDMTENPILVLAIGDKWACYVSSLPSNYDDPYYHDTGLIHGVSTYSTWLGIDTNGTIAYKNSIEMEGQTYTRDGLIAYISPNGDMKPYYNENVPKSSEVYTYMSSITMNETVDISLGAILRNGYADPTVFAGGDYYDGSVHEVDVSAEYIIDGDYITGLKVTAGLPSGTEVNTISLANQTPPISPEEGDMPQGTFAFSVVPSGTEETSGGGGSGSLSPTLVTVLSIIPIMVLVGLVLMAVRSMKV